MAEIGRAVLKQALARTTQGSAGTLKVGMDAAGDIGAQNLRSWLAALKDQADGKAPNGHSHNGLAPSGGIAGKVLKKNSAADYDYSWQDDLQGAGGGSAVPATESEAGIAPIATQAEVDAGLNDQEFVTPLKLAGWAGPMRFRDAATAREFGIKADGVTNDSAAFNTAMTEMNGGTLLMHQGDVMLGTVVEMPSKTRIKADDPRLTKIKPHSSAAFNTVLFKNKDVDLTTGAMENTDIVFENIGFDGAGRSYPRYLQYGPNHALAGQDLPATGLAGGPQEDHYDAATNPTGRIGHPSKGADDVAITNAVVGAGGGNMAINGTVGSSDMRVGSPAVSVRKITVTLPSPLTGGATRTFTITGTDYDGNARQEILVHPGNGAKLTTADIFRTVTTVHINGATGAGGAQVGIASFDIFGIVAEGRRNPLYKLTAYEATMILFQKVNRPKILNCVFENHRNTVITDAGCRDGRYHGNHFENCLKKDGPYFCFWVNRFAPVDYPAAYRGSDGTDIGFNTYRNLERIPALFAPTGGGRYHHNKHWDIMEGAAFTPRQGNTEGGEIRYDHNLWSRIKISDITAAGAEQFGPSNIVFEDNTVEFCDDEFLNVQGGSDKSYRRNTFKHCWQRTTPVPYGPFSERYDYNIGAEPEAGKPTLQAARYAFRMGSFTSSDLGAADCIRNFFTNNTVIDNRSDADTNRPSRLFSIERVASANNTVRSLTVADNDFTGVVSALLRDTANFFVPLGADTFDTAMNINLRNNAGHRSFAAYPFEQTFAAGTTGTVDVVAPGFRPRHIRALAQSTSLTDGRWADGDATYQFGVGAGSSTRSQSFRSAGAGSNSFAPLIILISSTGAVEFQASLSAWLYNGFQLNVTTATVGAKVKFVCSP